MSISRLAQSATCVLLGLLSVAATPASAAFGDPDVLFGNSGIWNPEPAPQPWCCDVQQQQAVAQDTAGRVYYMRSDGGLVRATAQGNTDITFGNGGSIALGAAATPQTLAVATDGKIYYAVAVPGTFGPIGNCAYSVRRLNADGSPDGSFTPVIAGRCPPWGLPPKIILNGAKVVTASPREIGVYLLDGTPDPAFNGGRTLAVMATDAAVSQADGAIFAIVAGSGLQKFLANGNLDSSFGSGGVVQVTVDLTSANLLSLTLDPDGKVVVGGISHPGFSDGKLFVARLTATGALDTTFGVSANGFGPRNGVVAVVPESPYYGNVLPRGIARVVDPDPFAATGPLPAEQYVFAGTQFFSDAPNMRGFLLHVFAEGGLPGGISWQGIVSYPRLSGGDLRITGMIPDISDAAQRKFIVAGLSDAPSAGLPAVIKMFATGAYPLTLGTLQPISTVGLGHSFFATFTASNGVGPYVFSFANGTPPPGLSIFGNAISGITTAAGSYEFTVIVTDAHGAQGAQSFVLHVFDDAALIGDYYESILRRAPDAGGLAFWQSQVQQTRNLGVSASEAYFALAYSFFNSPEYLQRAPSDTQFLTDLYRTFFDRDPDAAGLAFWSAQMTQGLPRDAVLNNFLFSPEFANFMGGIFGSANSSRAEVALVMDFYRGILGRLPDDAGFAFWAARFRAAQCNNTVALEANIMSALFFQGAEYQQREAARSPGQVLPLYLSDLYNAFLRRGGDLGGLQFWLGQMGAPNSLTKEQVRQYFVASPEFQGRVAAVQAQGCLP